MRAGFRATLPVALAITPFGMAYGAVAAQSMPVWQGQLMSLTVFAGTAQFIAASMLATGAGYGTILLTGLLLNLRLVLLSAALAPHLSRARRPMQLLLGQMLTDESFAVTLAEYEVRPSRPGFLLGSGLAIYSFWQISTLVGLLAGANLPGGLGLEFALPASLVCLVFLLVRARDTALVALLAAALTLALRPLVTDAWSVLAATMLAATVGMGVKAWRSHS